MTPALAALAAFLLYGLGYRFYAGFLARRVFRLDPAARTPAHELRDDVDYVPTRPAVLFGHHFASITGLAPMLGPAVAVIWGWLPALLWVVLGAVFAPGPCLLHYTGDWDPVAYSLHRAPHPRR
jgi:carbon starvation protein